MSYRILDLEIKQPLSSIMLSANETGIAVVLRRKGKPIAFWMEPAPENCQISKVDLSDKISDKARVMLISESIREELVKAKRPKSFPSLTIAICTRDRTCQLERCLNSLRSITPEVSGIPVSVEIVVVDNAPSDDQTEKLIATLPKVQYICEKRPGLNFARNCALKNAKGKLLAFLDDDVTVDKLWLEGLMESWAANPEAGAFTGLVLPLELVTEAQILFEKHGAWRKSFDRIVYGQTLPGDPLYPCGAGMFGTGANMAFRKNVLLEIGGFDEALDTGPPLPGGGDLDIFYRVIMGGNSLVYDPKYMVFHEHRRTLKDLQLQYRSWGLCLMAFIVKSSCKDPLQRVKFHSLTRQWFKLKLRYLIKSIRGHYVLPPRMVAAELWGGIIGLLGEYSRSQKRIEKINKQII